LNPLDKPEPAWAFKTESLVSGSDSVVSRGVRGQKENLAPSAGLAALKLVELAEDDAASQLLRTLQSYAIYCPNTPSLRATVPDPQTRKPVGLAGGALAEGFEALKQTCDEDTIDEVLELVDWVSEVSASESAGTLLSPAVPRAKYVLKFTDRFMATSRNTLTAYDASEGALYVLFAGVLCLSASSPPLFAIDNLDQALNPRLVARLVERLAAWLTRANAERQLLFTAHNPAVLDGLDLGDAEVRLFAVERNGDGHSQVRRIELSEELKALNTTYPLSRLWLMGNLGAVPNV
jgi:predicted ATPase